MNSTSIATIALGFALALPVRCLSAEYNVVNLGTLGGSSGGVVAKANGISANGLVTGVAYVGNQQHVFLYDGTMHDLGPGVGSGINNAGHIAGVTAAGNDILFYDGTMHDLGNGFGASINNSDQVTGITNNPGGSAFLYDGAMHYLGPNTAGGTAINDSGTVVGEFVVPDSIFPLEHTEHAFLYDGVLHDIGTPGGTNTLDPFGDYSYSSYTSIAWAINGKGDVAGTDDGVNGGFIFSGGVEHGIGAIVPTGINNSGDVIGSGALLYTSANGIVNLNSLIDPLSGWTLQQATGINDAGQIVGYGLYGGVTQAFLLTPVPEPSTVLLAALGGIVLLGYRARRRVV